MAKPHKVEEPAASYGITPKKSARAVAPAKKTSATRAIRYVDDAAFRKAADKVFKTHDELFRKLAQ